MGSEARARTLAMAPPIAAISEAEKVSIVMAALCPPVAVPITSLVGFHLLSGVDFGTMSPEACESLYSGGFYYDRQDVRCMLFILDGVTYCACEDPDDGYRSSLGIVAIVQDHVVNTFEPNRVFGRFVGEQYVIFHDVRTGKEVLNLGTDQSDSYYPSCIMQFTPEHMALNSPEKRDA